jgi:hypothetical protein
MFTQTTSKAFPVVLCCLALGGLTAGAYAQQIIGVSAEYGIFPYRGIANPDAGTMDEVLEIGLRTISFGASFPVVFGEGRTLLLNRVEYGHLDMRFRNWDREEEGDPAAKDAGHSAKYSAVLIHGLSQKWRLLAVATPGIASDFNGDFSTDEITFEAVLGLIHQLSEGLSLGFGVAYVRDFGEPLPLPFLMLEWQVTPGVRARAIVPDNIQVTYGMSPKLELGLGLKVSGNRYHGDPETWGAENPQVEHTIITAGPMAKIHISKWVHLFLDGGYVLYHNFEFGDGDRTSNAFHLDEAGYLRAGFQLGM